MDALLAWATAEAPSYLALLERVLAGAAAHKRERSVQRRIDHSGLRHRKTLEAFDWPFQPKLDRAVIAELATLGFLDRTEDIIVTGKTGTGKSHILQAIALRACQADVTVRYARCVDLIDDLYAGLADGTYPRRLDRWCRPRLLVIDDVGLGQLKRTDDEPTAAHLLFNLVDRRHELTSTAVSSNLKLSAWGQYLGDSMMAAAILDRLAEHSIRIDIDGPSYRQHRAHQRSARPGPAASSATEPTHRNKEPEP
jgi:DNA replication protein DnaC